MLLTNYLKLSKNCQDVTVKRWRLTI